MDELMIKVDNVYKEYRLGQIGGTTLYEELQRKFAKWRGKEDPTKKIGAKSYVSGEKFQALKGVSFEARKGERVGIIGHNGAGKSTLLKLISRVTAPSQGEIGMNGRVTSMLEVGTGFHRELTGRENIYLNGAILGMTKKEINAKIENIIEFSECRQFIDTPVKRYSSGMYVKLAFSVAAHLDSEIMIMDEVLAVGDMAFQKKCIDKMNEVSRLENRTVLYVSHNMNTIRQLCERVIVLDHGSVVFDGDVEEGIRIYMGNDPFIEKAIIDLNDGHHRMNNHTAQSLIFDKLAFKDSKIPKVERGEPISFTLFCTATKVWKKVYFRLEVKYIDGNVFGSMFSNEEISFTEVGEHHVDMTMQTHNFPTGRYYVDIVVFQVDDLGNNVYLVGIYPGFAFEITTMATIQKLRQWDHKYWGHVQLDDVIVK